MQIDAHAVAMHYRQLSDDRLVDLATNEAAELTGEALGVLQDELRRRGLDTAIDKTVVRTLESLRGGEFDLIVAQFRSLPCPQCGGRVDKLNAFRIDTVVSAIVLTFYQPSVVVGCPSCLARAARVARRTTLILGWWGIPWGPIRSAAALRGASRALAGAAQSDPTEDLLDYVRRNLANVCAQIEASLVRERV